MRTTAGMKLVFRIGECGFSLPVEDLIEIRDNSAGLIDRSAGDDEGRLLGELFHRGETIGIRDLGGRLGILPPGEDRGRAILVLASGDRPWGVVADRVEGLFPETEFNPVELPHLLTRGGQLPYRGLETWRDELLVSCEAPTLGAVWEAR